MSYSIRGKRISMTRGETYPANDGETEFAPSESGQTVGTHGKAVPTDIIVYSS